ncbi:MAG TPA: class I SAM-dependent methyltransferase [Panacibacter sp.]|nr:class I SAM-dependent methyltransferase [Panacibacter sp.]
MKDLFTELEQQYNLHHPSERREFFTKLVTDRVLQYKSPTVLDIGCGDGIGRTGEFLQQIKAVSGKLMGIDPDPNIQPANGIFDYFENTLFELSNIPDHSVDIAYSSMVMEHVVNPDEFFKKLYRVLKPGGCYLFLTVNGNHYFAFITRFMKSIGAEELALKIARGRKAVAEYHYPVAYKINTPKQIDTTAANNHFEKPRYVFIERSNGGKQVYFPGPLILIWHALMFKRKIIKRKQDLLELICLVKKPSV